MKRFEDFTKKDLTSLRNEIVLNSCYTSDYNNSFGISADSVAAFFDGYYDFIWELAEEKYGKKGLTHEIDVAEFDNADTLEEWFDCHDDFGWVEYIY